ncbi:hypothetical protein NDN08_006397 [Rhodosorus marinus]|uniref:Uncharacterized protein n=1 Tax=Rhodosorus marinus TaxID=101924 RepID=A0AAV8UPM3_9RHOD|nr:hypothetical protein NDN08_006397 [Rhodosorus marinus]
MGDILFASSPKVWTRRTSLPITCKRTRTGFHAKGIARAREDCDECEGQEEAGRDEVVRGNVRIEYCTGCRWLLRAGWTAQELLTTFEKELVGVTIAPATSSGVFDVYLDGKLVFSRKEVGRFPEMKELKQLVRDQINPERDLGHSDVKGHKQKTT